MTATTEMIRYNNQSQEDDSHSGCRELQAEVICYRCKWGNRPGKFRCCGSPEANPTTRYILPPYAVAVGKCNLFVESIENKI